MLKQVGLIVATVAVLVAVFVFGARSFSPTFQQCIQTHDTTKESRAAEENPSRFGMTISIYIRCSGEFFDDHEGSIAALATIIIAAFTGTLWFATNKHAELARETFVADKRAFVFTDNFRPFWEQIPGGGYNWRFRPIWKNSGDTPTSRMRLYSACELRNTPLPKGFDFNQAVVPGTGLLGPKSEGFGGITPLPANQPAITPANIQDVQAGRMFLYLWGWARYFDIFPGTEEHLTRFCWLILPFGDPTTYDPTQPPGPMTLRFDHILHFEGNCADEDCG
jgi:hypothetical protein